MWIWGKSWKDIAWLYMPGVLALGFAFSRVFPMNSTGFWIFAFIASGLLDSGHVYATLWRTYFHARERSRTWIYKILPPLIFIFFLVWLIMGAAYLGSFIVYATLFHNVRQFFGISKWYQKLNGRARVDSDLFFYFLTLAPVLMAHFRSDVQWPEIYTSGEVLIWPRPDTFLALFVIYGMVACGWVIYELSILKKHGEWNRTLSVAFPAAIYAFSFLLGKTEAEILFPLVAAHGAAYLGLTSLSVKRVRAPKLTPRRIAFGVFATALLFGTLEVIFESQWLDFSNPVLAPFLALYLTPLFSHYVFDAILWKSSHPEAKLIYIRV